MITEAIILAGGLGTRLRSVVLDLPKCMAPVQGHPFLKYVIDYFRNQGTQKFIFSLGYKHELIEKYLQSHFKDLSYSVVIEDEPLGTGGANYKSVARSSSKDILVLNGDTYFEIDLQALSDFHDNNNADCTLSLKEMKNSSRYGIVETNDEKRIQSFKEKSFYAHSFINGGVYALNVKNFSEETFPKKFSFEKDYFEKFYKEKKMFGLVQEGYFIDIGIPDDYQKAQTDFQKFN